ncbi:hypothetical protein M23134_08103 [Microscilla marina ATCC 23134]|uniref:Uncharacterized protein n=1 Tax=Microscilla marina ATCC 23134 TaxID=313606 RepID=A1ZH10_MICM2|nr:hypothetical protein M23134_08103 [Microscilla marina ATCC 23134]
MKEKIKANSLFNYTTLNYNFFNKKLACIPFVYPKNLKNTPCLLFVYLLFFVNR